MQATRSTTLEDLASPREVLGFIRDSKAAANAAEVEVLEGAVLWAEQHPPECIHDAATWPGTAGIGGETELVLAGEGAPAASSPSTSARPTPLPHRDPSPGRSSSTCTCRRQPFEVPGEAWRSPASRTTNAW